jgi:hypothetical protein
MEADARLRSDLRTLTDPKMPGHGRLPPDADEILKHGLTRNTDLCDDDTTPVPVGNSILLATDIESGDAPALCQRSVA